MKTPCTIKFRLLLKGIMQEDPGQVSECLGGRFTK